jgi:inosose dehydratase
MCCSLELCGGPVSWGVDFADAPGNPAWESVLDGIAAAGLRWAELGPVGFLPRGASGRAARDARGLRAGGTFVFDDFHRPEARAAVLAATRSALAEIRATGGTRLVLIDRPDPVRAASAGRGAEAPRLAPGAWAAMVETLRRAAAEASAVGIRAVLHPHAGGYVEFEDELAAVLDAIAADELGLCIDTGHALYAGSDPAALIRSYGARLEHLHLKDLDGAVASRGLGFWDAVEAGVFCPVGDGVLDLAALRPALAAVGYRGVATIEQDRRPGTAGSPVEDLRRSVERLRAAGLG